MIKQSSMEYGLFSVSLYILSTAVAYLCVIAVQHFLNDPHGEIYKGNFPVLVPFNTVVCDVITI